MKKRLLFLIGAVALLFTAAACSIEEPEASLRHLDFDVNVDSDLPGTRAVKSSWETGDKIYVIFDNYLSVNMEENNESPCYATLVFNGTKWEGSFSNPALEQYLLGRSEGRLAACFIPFYEPTFRYSTIFGVEIVNPNRPFTYYMTCEDVPYTISGGKLSATLPMTLSTFVHFYLGGLPDATSGRYRMNCTSILASRASSGFYDRGKPVWGSSNGYYGGDIPGMPYQGGVSFSGRLMDYKNGQESLYEIVVTDTKGTDTIEDDYIYTLAKTTTLYYRDAVVLPPLTDPAWSLKKPKREMYAEWGLEGTFEKEMGYERPYEWYIDQGSTGACSGVNCGPASSVMAAKWYNYAFTGTVEDARAEIYNNGGWWYTNDIDAYFNAHNVAHTTKTFTSTDDVVWEINMGNIVLLCLDMYYITYGNQTGKRVNKFYNTANKGWGHFLLVKGYVQTSTKLYYEVYDPYSMGRTNPDGTPMGRSRYYDAAEILHSAGIWWPNMIVVGDN